MAPNRGRTMLCVLLVAVAFAACGGDQCTSLGGARTYYESLDLESPEAGAATFVRAFARDDFMTVFFALDDEAHLAFQQHLALLEYDRLLDTASVPDLQAELRQVLSPELESFDMWHLFDRLMLMAGRHDAFLIDLGGEVTFEETASSDVSAVVAGIDGAVVFRMVESPSGRWRVRQVLVPGGDETILPWSVPVGPP